jgi:hypothetical protein
MLLLTHTSKNYTMKKFALLGIFSITAVLFSQPTITSSEYLLSVGDILTVYSYQSLYTAPTEGAAQTWDYTSLDVTTPTTKNIIDPSTSGIAGLGSSTLCSDLQGSIDCFLIETGGIQRTGLGGFGSNFPYQNPEYVLKFPISYGYNDSDSFQSNFMATGFNGIRHGKVNYEVTGYGTLLLPNSITLNNVLQIKYVDHTIDSVDVFGDWQTADHNFVRYYFYAPNYHGEVLQMSSGSSHFVSMGTDTTLYPSGTIYQLLGSGAGTEPMNEKENFDLYPNPVNERFTLTSKENIPENCRYTILNVNGQILQTGVISANNLTVQVPMLNPGFYILQIIHQDIVISKRFIKN